MRRVLAALLRIGWAITRTTGSHRTLTRPGWPKVRFAYHDGEARPGSRPSSSNVFETERILTARGARSLLLVTSALHMPRAGSATLPG